MEDKKTCTKCNKTKPVSEFHKCSRNPDGLRYRCKKCVNKIDREYYASTIKRRFSRFAIWIKKNHGVTGEEYKEMLSRQGGVCAICGKVNITKSKRLAIDHCHKTGKIRGLLCGRCNMGIGQFDDKASLLIAAAEYIRKSITLPEQE